MNKSINYPVYRLESDIEHKLKVIIFDLDNTLYPDELGVFPLIDARINSYMSQRLEIPKNDVDALRRVYWKMYGATLQGLMLHHRADPEDFLQFVHDIDLIPVLKPDSTLNQALSSLQMHKVILTNASREHALKVLKTLGVQNQFEHIFDIRTADYRPKPHKEPYLKVLDSLKLKSSECVMVDDLPDNLKTAKELGMHTVLIGEENGFPYVDCCLGRACGIEEVLHRLRP